MIIYSFTKRNEMKQTDVISVNTKTVSRGKSRVQGASGTVWIYMREIPSGTEKGEAMSIILKGIDMPEDGGTIVLKIKGSKIYQEYPSGYKFQPTRIKDAKAIQIPKDHGRIIDENEAIENVACFDGTAWLDTDGIKPLLETEE